MRVCVGGHGGASRRRSPPLPTSFKTLTAMKPRLVGALIHSRRAPTAKLVTLVRVCDGHSAALAAATPTRDLNRVATVAHYWHGPVLRHILMWWRSLAVFVLILLLSLRALGLVLALALADLLMT